MMHKETGKFNRTINPLVTFYRLHELVFAIYFSCVLDSYCSVIYDSLKTVVSIVNMKLVTKFLFATVLTSFLAHSASIEISASQAPFYVGEKVIACGMLAQTSRFKRGVYLNLDEKYPKQPLTLVVWEDDLAQFQKQHGDLTRYLGRKICGQGTVSQYKGRSQISLYNAYSLQIKK